MTFSFRRKQGLPEGSFTEDKEFKLLFDSLLDGLAFADVETKRFLAVNEAFSQMLGYSEAELRSMGVTDIHPSDALPHVLEEFEKQARREIRIARDIPVLRKDGRIFYADINSSLIVLGGKQYLLGTFRDVTERKESEEAVRRSEERLELEISRLPIGHVVWDKDFKVVTWNAAAEKIFGFSFGEMKGKHPYGTIVPTAVQPQVEIVWHKLLQGDESTANSLNENITKDGRTILCDWTNTPLRDKDGMVIGAMSTVEDVTQKVKAEEALRKSAEELKKFKMAVDSASDLIMLTDPAGKIIFVNKNAEHFTGFPREEIIGKTPALWGGQMSEDFYQKMWATIHAKRVFEGQIVNRRKDGGRYDAELHISPILGPDGEVAYFLGVEQDITKLKEVDQAKSEFISLASHQLRTPITTMSWYLEMLLEGDAGALSKKQEDYVEKLYAAARQMNDILKSFLYVLRLETGDMKVHPVKMDLAKLGQETLEEFAVSIRNKQIDVSESCSGLSPFSIDPDIAKIILQNLISNAIKYTPEKGSVHISCAHAAAGSSVGGREVSEESMVITVQDSGIGIPQKDQEKIFTRFFRADNAKTADPDGNGLGLYIVNKMTALMKGSVWFESEEGKGTTFYLALPLNQHKESVA